MKSKLDIPTLILSAGLASGVAMTHTQELNHSIERTKENTFQVLS